MFVDVSWLLFLACMESIAFLRFVVRDAVCYRLGSKIWLCCNLLALHLLGAFGLPSGSFVAAKMPSVSNVLSACIWRDIDSPTSLFLLSSTCLRNRLDVGCGAGGPVAVTT